MYNWILSEIFQSNLWGAANIPQRRILRPCKREFFTTSNQLRSNRDGEHGAEGAHGGQGGRSGQHSFGGENKGLKGENEEDVER